MAACVRGFGLPIYNDKLWNTLFVTTSEVRVSFFVLFAKYQSQINILTFFVCKLTFFLQSSIFCHRDLTEIVSTELKLILFIVLEHFLLLVAWMIHKAIPDRPRSVRLALAKADYESKLALKREVVNQFF